MCVDGEMALSEQEKIRELSMAIGWDEALVNATIVEQITAPTELSAILDAITDPETQETAVTVCSAIVAADGKFLDPERTFVTQLCEAWGFDKAGLIEGIEQALTAT